MTQAMLTEILGWCLVINTGILTLSAVGVIGLRGIMTSIQSKLFGLNEEELRRAFFQYLAQFKIAVIVLNLTPYIAMKVVA